MSEKSKIILIIIVIAIVVGFFWGLPQWNVWRRGLAGKAQLKEAEWNRQIAIKEAEAELESAKLLRQAEVERAKGVAESTNIISQELEQNENYLQYLAIQAQMKMAQSENHTTVYIPSGYNGIPLIKDIDK